jgi:dTDP-4-amino-4,6-dideoxygalactose transaminase
MQGLLEQGISTRAGIMCAHREPAYFREPWSCAGRESSCDCQPGSCAALPRSEAAQDTGLILPMFHEMTGSDQERVVGALLEAVATCLRQPARSRG